MSWKLFVRTLLIGWTLGMVCACTPESVTLQSATARPLVATNVPEVTSSAAASGEWQQIEPAMELRTLRLTAGQSSGFATVVRLDPAAYKISVKYDVENPGTVREWFDALKPIAVMNGGYFDENGRATALVIFDGIRRGESYDGFGGMVVINAQGEFELRSLRDQPFDPNEELQQAMQSSPMLIQPGGALSDFEADEDRSRRSVIARDAQGRILLIASNAITFTLSELAQALKDSDLNLDAALNLDGGRSTGLFLRTAAASVTIDSIEKVPLVLTIEPR
jgi:exopolysaccharide biosynthesis protein